MKMSENPAKHEVLIEQYLRSILGISAPDMYCFETIYGKRLPLRTNQGSKHYMRRGVTGNTTYVGQAWSTAYFLYGKRTLFFCGTQQVIPSGQDSAILPAQVARHSAVFSSRSYLNNK